jgi:hypothetical protein
VFGAIHIAEGLKTPLAATSEARKAIVADESPQSFPLEEKVGFRHRRTASNFLPPRGTKNATLATIDERMTSPLFVCNRTSHRPNF